MVTVARSSDSAIEAMRHGAYDYLLKPIDLQKLDHVINEALKVSRLMREPARIVEGAESPPPMKSSPASDIIGCCPGMRGSVPRPSAVSPTRPFHVLITGEKWHPARSLSPRAIYQHSPRASGPVHWPSLNCAAIPENLLESELFGHEQGAFTGASRRRIGKFEQCNDGTLLLDEIGDMPPAYPGQDAARRAPGAGVRAASAATRRSAPMCGWIAATHRDLKARGRRRGSSRPDLYYRLGVLHHPPAPIAGAGR